MTDGPLPRPFRFPTGLLGMLVLVILIERAIASHDAWFMTPHEHDWRAAGRNATTRSVGAEILVFGDSMLKFGLSPVILEQRLHRPTFSLALLDGKPAASYFLLRRAIDAGTRPRLILVDFQPECLYQPKSTLSVNRHWKGLLNPREAYDYARNYGDADFFNRIMLSRWLSSYGCRTEIRSNLMLALQGQASSNPRDNAKVARNRNRNHGGLLLAPVSSYRGEVHPGFAETLYAADWFQRAENTRYVRRFMALAHDHGIGVVWVLPPNVPEVESTRERIGLRARYDAFITGLTRLYPNVHIFDGRRSGFGADLFVDPVHLDRNGADALSHSTADALERLLANGTGSEDADRRWVRLDRTSFAGPGIALEDMEQSLERALASDPRGSLRR